MQGRHLSVEFFDALEHLRHCEQCRLGVLVRETFLAILEDIYGDPPVQANRPGAPNQ